MQKKILFFIVLLPLICKINIVLSEIIPIKKPLQTEEETQKRLLVDVLKPPPKPVKKTEKKTIKQKVVVNEEKKIGLILPKKKPLIAGSKKAKNIKISKYFSKKDFNVANKAISEMKKAKWSTALKTSKKARDKSIYNFIQWRHLLTKGNQASYYDYKTFIDKNEDYPRIGRVKYLAEHKLSTDKISPKKIIDWYGSSEPLSGFGRMILGESYTLTGNKEKGVQLIKEGWITAELTKSELRFYRKKFRKYLEAEDYIKRADYLAWNNKYWDLKRMLRYFLNFFL